VEVEANSTTKSESKSKRSRDERSIIAVSSPVIKVYGSTGVDVVGVETEAMEATLDLEVTEAADRISPNGAWIKSEAKGIIEKDAPVSNTIGRVGARVGPTDVGVGTEAEAEATTVGATVGGTAVAVGVAEAKVSTVGPAPIRETSR